MAQGRIPLFEQNPNLPRNYWDDPASIDIFIGTLQTAASRMSNKNMQAQVFYKGRGMSMTRGDMLGLAGMYIGQRQEGPPSSSSGAGSGQGGAGGAGDLQGATNAVTRQATGGGPELGRGASTQMGTAADVRTEFSGINSYPPDTQILPQEAKDAENVDSVTRRGALGKRPGLIKTWPDKDEIVNSVAAVAAGLGGRSINALPVGFHESGNTSLLLGYDNRTDLGKGTSSANSKRVRTVPVFPLWHGQHDIRNVRPVFAIVNTTAATMQFSLTLPTRFKKDSGGTRLASVDQLVVIVSILGYQLDRDNEDSLQGTYLKEYTAWDGNAITVNDVGVVGVRRYYTVWFANKRHFSKPFTFSLVPT